MILLKKQGKRVWDNQEVTAREGCITLSGKGRFFLALPVHERLKGAFASSVTGDTRELLG